MWCWISFLLVALTTLTTDCVQAHPQCLDSLPPFEPANRHPFCREYQSDVCCTEEATVTIRLRVKQALKSAEYSRDSEQWKECREVLRQLACTECSPYAAHIYEAETLDQSRKFPSVCYEKCLEFYPNCSRAIFAYFDQLNSSSYTDSDGTGNAEQFCKDQLSADTAHCYPDVIGGPNFTSQPEPPSSANDECLCGLPIATGLRNPIVLVHSNDQTGRLFVAEQLGVVWVLTRERERISAPFLDITDRVLISNFRGDERGLLGMAFHPDFKTGYCKFYVYYSTRVSFRHYSYVSEFDVPDCGNAANKSSERVIFRVEQPQSNHNGGQIMFDHDDKTLFIFLGDGGGGGDRHGAIGHGQNKETLHGSILRVNVTAPGSLQTYTIPLDNPYYNQNGVRQETYAYGLRNPWRCSVDRGDPITGEGKGRMFCGDVGQNAFEEIDIIVKGGNYGWRAFEGCRCFDSRLCPGLTDDIKPIHAYNHTVGRSITGGYVYRGCTFPRLQGKYFFADFVTGFVATLTQGNGSSTPDQCSTEEWKAKNVCFGDESVCHSGLLGYYKLPYHVLSFGEDEAGELYVLATDNYTPSNPSGMIYQIVDPQRRAAPSQCN